MLCLVICWLICTIDAVTRVCCGPVFHSVWFLSRTMCRPIVFVLAFLFLLSVQGFEVVANIRFSRTSYVVYEKSEICIDVINELEPTDERFSVSYNFDSRLSGYTSNVRKLDGVFYFNPGDRSSSLCIQHRVDSIACEPDIVGSVQLFNSTVVKVIEPFTATVTIRDDNIVNISFVQLAYIISEGGLLVGQQYPQINSTLSVDTPFMIRLSEGVRKLSLLTNVSSSLSIQTENFAVSDLQHEFAVSIQDDDIALEDPEVVPLVMEIIGSQLCDVFLSPINLTRVVITDNDDVTIGLKETILYVTENEETVRVCVTLSGQIARVLPFQLLVTTVTATDEQDFRGSTIKSQFEPFSNNLEICLTVPIINDQVIEPNESFQVNLHIPTTFPSSVRRHLKEKNRTATVIIIDTSQCTNIAMETESAVIYVAQKSSICFTCTACQTNVSSSLDIFWYIGDRKLSVRDPFSEGKAFPNGTLMITNSSLVFNAKEATSLSCGKPHENGSDSTQLEILYPFKVVLGVSPFILDIALLFDKDHNDTLFVKCVFGGSPQPSVSWLFNGEQISRETDVIQNSDTSGDTYRYESVLTVHSQELREKMEVEFTCVVRNMFGQLRTTVPHDIQVTNSTVTSKIVGSSAGHTNKLDCSVLTLVTVLVSLYVCLSNLFCSH